MLPVSSRVIGLPGSAPRCALSEPEEPPADPNKLIRRAYSIASSSLSREYMDFYVALVTTGALTPRLFDLKIGDRIWLGPKITGMFTFDQVPADANVVMIATGTGLAPYMSMLSTHLMCGGAAASRRAARRPALVGPGLPVATDDAATPVPQLHLSADHQPAERRTGAVGAVPAGYVQDLWKHGAVAQAWGFTPTPDEHPHLPLRRAGNDRRDGSDVAGRGVQGTHEEGSRGDSRREVLVDWKLETGRSSRLTETSKQG